jgi:hypothetical protein
MTEPEKWFIDPAQGKDSNDGKTRNTPVHSAWKLSSLVNADPYKPNGITITLLSEAELPCTIRQGAKSKVRFWCADDLLDLEPIAAPKGKRRKR